MAKSPTVGTAAPEFRLTGKDLEDIGLEAFRVRKCLLNILPSLDSKTCATSTRKFNESFEAREDAVALVVSANLPFAQNRFCSIDGLTNLTPLSMMLSKKFAKDYGLLMNDAPLAGLSARAVVLDESGKVIYTELVKDIAGEPNYEAALAALG